MKKLNPPWMFFLIGLFCCSTVIYAEHADIDLRVRSPRDEVRSTADEDPPAGGIKPRPVLAVKAGEPLALQFLFVNTYPHHDLKDVTIRYYVVRTDKIGQKTVPPLKEGVVTQGQVVMNFKVRGNTGARFPLRIHQPGIYLVRVESLNTGGDHEHFSAVDLKVE